MAKILVVDDEPNIVKLLQVNLQRAGYQVVTASDGLEALAKVKQEQPDLVLLDVIMPRLDGWKALERLRSDPATTELPVVMLTAKAQDGDIFDSMQKGAHLHITKPFNPLALLTLIQRILQARQEDANERVYHLGD